MHIAVAVLAVVVAAMYAFLGMYVLPRLAALAQRNAWARRGQVGAAAFFLGCAITHVAIAGHTLSEPGVVGGHVTAHLLPHIAQIVGGAVFAYVALNRLELKITARAESAAEAELQRLREEVARNERLQSLGHLAGMVAHDFNNLLAVILSYAHFAKSNATDPAVADDVEQIIRAADSGADLTRQLLAYSRRQEPQHEIVDVNDELLRLEPLVRRILRPSVTLELQLAADLPPVEVGIGQLDQVVVNLAVNARDASPGGGGLTISTTTRDGRVRMEFRDDGVGMSPDVAERVFEPFFTTKQSDGTGFGLATVQAIVKAAAGTVRIESAVGRGTTIVIELPAARGERPREAVAETPRSVRHLSVLIVEDDADLRRGIERMLGDKLDVVTAGDGRAALESLASRADIDVLVTNLAVTGMSGADLIERVRAARPGIGVVCTSGWHDRDGQWSQPPADVVLVSKPFTPDELLAAIEHAAQPTRSSRTPLK